MASFSALIFTYRGTLTPLTFVPVMALPPEPHGNLRFWIGSVLVGLGFLVRILGSRRIGGRAKIHSGGAKGLITSGIYGHVRNPLYVGNILVICGAAVLFHSVLILPLALAWVATVYMVATMYEERSLADLMGEPYLEYRRNVPAWIFRLTPYRGDSPPEPPVTWSGVLRQERWFLFICCLLVVSAPLLNLAWPAFFSGGDPLINGIRLFGAAAVVVVSALLVMKVGKRLRRKRGSWLAVHRISKVR